MTGDKIGSVFEIENRVRNTGVRLKIAIVNDQVQVGPVEYQPGFPEEFKHIFNPDFVSLPLKGVTLELQTIVNMITLGLNSNLEIYNNSHPENQLNLNEIRTIDRNGFKEMAVEIVPKKERHKTVSEFKA